MKKMLRVACCGMLCLLFFVQAFPIAQAYSSIAQAIDGVYRWKKGQNGGAASDMLFTAQFAQSAGDGCDWYMIAAGRDGLIDNPKAYLNFIAQYVTEKYRTANKLDRSKATEWHRIALAVLAAGGDPRKIGTDENGVPVDLIADGVYNRGLTVSLGKQGLNGWIWGLIALDSKQYAVPQDSFYTREQILKEILSYQLPDGGFSFVGTKSDSDTTAAALIALAPYASSGTAYTYTLKRGKTEVKRTVPQIVQQALARLSEIQLSSGGFTASGDETSESVSQVIIALCSIGIDPRSDRRFLKNGSSPVDALMSFRQNDGGFAHLQGGGSDSIAGEQALCALVALKRLENGMARLYDYTDGMTMKTAQSGSADSTSNKPSGSSHSSAVQTGNAFRGQQSSTAFGGDSSAAGSSGGQSFAGNQSREQSSPSSQNNTSSQNKSNNLSGDSGNTMQSAVQENSSKAGEQKKTHAVQNTPEEEKDGINPIIFIIIGAALIAGSFGFHLTKMKSRKEEDGQEEDFFESLKKYRDENADDGEDGKHDEKEK